MTPVWVFPAYPLLLSAPYGSNLIAAVVKVGEVSRINATPIAFCALSVQGTGFLISFMICAAFIYRLMTQKLPRDMQRPGVVCIHLFGDTVRHEQLSHTLGSSFPSVPAVLLLLG